MKKIIRLTESDLTRIVKRVIKEQSNPMGDLFKMGTEILKKGGEQFGRIAFNTTLQACKSMPDVTGPLAKQVEDVLNQILQTQSEQGNIPNIKIEGLENLSPQALCTLLNQLDEETNEDIYNLLIEVLGNEFGKIFGKIPQ